MKKEIFGSILSKENLYSRINQQFQVSADWDSLTFSYSFDGEKLNTTYFDIFLVGRIDNLNDLKHKTGVACDNTVEFLLHFYQNNQENFGRDLCGSFIIVINDKIKKELIIINDHYSFIPFFYFFDNHNFIFSNNISKLLKTELFEVSPNWDSIAEYLSPTCVVDECGLTQGVTFFSNINQLPYATILKVKKVGNERLIVTSEKYWNPCSKIRRDIKNQFEIAEEFSFLFKKVISDMTFGKKKVGFELSGGIDSGAAICMAYETKNIQDIYTYTLSGGTTTWNLEEAKIQSLLEFCQVKKGHFIEIGDLYDYVELSDISHFSGVVQPNYLNLPAALAKIMNKAEEDNCDLLISGEGADWYLEGSDMIWDSLVKQKKWKQYINQFIGVILRGGLVKSLPYIFSNSIIPILPKSLANKRYLEKFYESTVKEEIPNIFSDEFMKKIKETNLKKKQEISANSDFELWSQRLEHELMFPPNHNWQSLNFTVDYGLPYLDRRLIDFGLSVPPEYKFNLNNDTISYYGAAKKLQRVGLSKYIPKNVIDCQHKSVYDFPVTNRVTKNFKMLINEQSLLNKYEVISVEKSHDLYDSKFMNNKIDIKEKNDIEAWLDSVMSLELWLRTIQNQT